MRCVCGSINLENDLVMNAKSKEYYINVATATKRYSFVKEVDGYLEFDDMIYKNIFKFQISRGAKYFHQLLYFRESDEKFNDSEILEFETIIKKDLIEKLNIFIVDFCKICNISPNLLGMKSKKRFLADIRAAYFLLAKEKFNEASLTLIGSLINKSHCTVLVGINRAKNVTDIMNLINQIRSLL